MADQDDAKAPSAPDASTEPHDFAEDANANEHDGAKDKSTQPSREGTPPPLPPRPLTVVAEGDENPHTPAKLTRPTLQSKATTALSLPHVQSHTEASAEARASAQRLSRRPSYASLRLGRSRSGSDVNDDASIKSYAFTLGTGAEVESILGEVISGQELGLKSISEQYDIDSHLDNVFPADEEFEDAFKTEFDPVDEINPEGTNEDAVLAQWKAKLKHFMILSSAGKPIYSRHGDDRLTSHYIGVVQTIIASYQDVDDAIESFTAGVTRFVILLKGPLNLVAVSRMGENDSQLRAQLEALYMQILSTLTLPSMERMFSNRPSTDLRRPLQGTESLLSALADGFTRGSPTTLLSALECLRLRKSHRTQITNTFLKTRCPSLLYGLIVASNKLVSVIRPKKHSLHPGDLHLIFNMLFEAGSVKAAGGENWIPLCLPGFNNTGYVYMYVSFLKADQDNLEEVSERPTTASSDDEVAIIFISANKEGFFELKKMRDELVAQLRKTQGLSHINAAIKTGRLTCTDIVPGTPLRHFLYKSKGNVQFVMPSLQPNFSTDLDRRRLMSLYHNLSAAVHSRPMSLKVQHTISVHCISLVWTTPVFELYCVAPGNTSRQALTQAANKVVQWVRREEERVFIIGGGVF